MNIPYHSEPSAANIFTGRKTRARFCPLLLSAALFSGFAAFFYGLCGAAVSLLGSALLKQTGRFSPFGVSVAGGVLHNLGQIALAALVLQSGYLFAYLPVLLLSGTLAGAVVGLLAGILIRRTDVK